MPAASRRRRARESKAGQMEVRNYSLREILRRMAPLWRPRTRYLVISSLLVSISAATMAAVPMLGKIFIDLVLPSGKVHWALVVAGAFLAVCAVRLVTWYYAQMILLWVGEEVVFRMRQNGFRHLQRLCLRFHSKYPSGFLYNRMFEHAICTIGVFFRSIFTQLTVYIVALVFSLCFCLSLSWQMTGVILVGAVAYVTVARKMAPRIYRRHRHASDAHNWIAGFILDRLRGTKTIQAFSMEDRVQEEFDRKVWPMQVKWIAAQRQNVRLTQTTEGLGYIVTSVVWVTGTLAVLNWGMSTGTLIAFVGYQAQFTAIVSVLAGMYGQFAAARAAFDLYHTVMDTQSTVKNAPVKALPRQVAGHLEFRDVTFAYDEKIALRDLSFEVPPGQTVALVGRSGGGKTTVANLLLRFYDPDNGAVLLDGQDVRQYPLREYRSLYGVVLQDPFLFNDTVEANLRCARPAAGEQDLWDALDKARAREFVEAFREGIHYRVGEGGTGLSGGQRQRLSIARCMLLDPKFLILDEATSALDNETERHIQSALDALFENRTAFVIAHRLSTIRRANRILVLDEGRVVEDGDFEQLLEAKGLFYYLYTIATSTSTRQFKLDEAGFA